MADAVHNIGRASLLVLGLQRNDLDLVARGLEDRVHQPRRESLYPRSMELMRKAQELGAVGASISGAGPTVLFWIHWQQTGAVMDAVRQAAPDCDVRRVQFTPAGADVTEL
jgi:homoserine kinase